MAKALKKLVSLRKYGEEAYNKLKETGKFWSDSHLFNDALMCLLERVESGTFISKHSLNVNAEKEVIRAEKKREERERAKRRIELGKMIEHVEEMNGTYDEKMDSVSFPTYSKPFPKSKEVTIGKLTMPRADFMARVVDYKANQYTGVTKEEVEKAIKSGKINEI